MSRSVGWVIIDYVVVFENKGVHVCLHICLHIFNHYILVCNKGVFMYVCMHICMYVGICV
jgi:hypothetical protein